MVTLRISSAIREGLIETNTPAWKLLWMAQKWPMEFQVIHVSGLIWGKIPFISEGFSVNGITPASSSSTSRRNSVSSTLKCDNVTKYPDRRQIEDKLHQIREYLEVTSSLMTNIRNSDEQVTSAEISSVLA